LIRGSSNCFALSCAFLRPKKAEQGTQEKGSGRTGSLYAKRYLKKAALRLVTQTLLVAVLLHALLALMLVDLGLTTFLDGAHGLLLVGVGG
jgi:hypothetical protein